MKHFVTRITNPSSARARRERKLLVLTIIALLVCWPLPDRAHAAAGDLDPTFGSGGKVTTEFSGSFEGAHDVTIQPDGKIVAAGFFINPTIGFAIVRYKSDGSLDPNFGSGGKVTTSFFGNADVANAIALQDDGKILAAGFASRPTTMQDFALARYNSDGSLDSSFGSGGKVTTDFSNNSEAILSIAIQPNGKIVAGGETFVSGNNRAFAFARYNSDGSLDSSFGSGGKVAIDFFGGFDVANSIVLQPDGKIVAVGIANSSSMDQDIALVRCNSDGSLDSGFGSGGKVTTDFFGGSDGGFAVALQSDGKIIAAGQAQSNINDNDFALVRYNPDGSLDSGFGTAGKVATNLSDSFDLALSVILQPDGKIIAGGTALNDFAIVRYNSDGSLDSTFGSGGQVLTDFFRNSDTIQALALQTDGKVVAAGIAFKADFDSNFAIARYDGDGPIFNVCLQDDSNGNLLQFNSATGDYQFTNCRKGIILGGKGSVRVRFCKIELSASKPDHTITALANTCTKAGSASVKLLPSGNTFTISDRDMTNNTCACR